MKLLAERYQNHWHPSLHSAHRAITSFPGRVDPIILESLKFSRSELEAVRQRLVNSELVIWVDPGEVAFRMGERGSVVTVYEEKAAEYLPQKQKAPDSFYPRQAWKQNWTGGLGGGYAKQRQLMVDQPLLLARTPVFVTAP